MHEAYEVFASLEPQQKINPVHDTNYDWLPSHQVPQPIQQLTVQNVCSLPAGVSM